MLIVFASSAMVRRNLSVMAEKHTNWNHALVVVIQVFLDNLKQCSNRPPVLRIRSTFKTQKLILNLHFRKGARQSSDDSLIRNLVHLDTNHDAEIEHKFVAFVFLIFDTDRVTKNPVFVVRVAYRDIPIAKCLSWDNVFGHRLEIKETRLVYTWLGDNTSWWRLMNHLSAWRMSDVSI